MLVEGMVVLVVDNGYGSFAVVREAVRGGPVVGWVDDEDIPVTNVVSDDGSNGSNQSYLDWHNEEEPVFWEIEQQTGKFCWVHAIVDTLEGLYAITHGERIKLSKQELVDNVFASNRDNYDEVTNTYSSPMEKGYHWIMANGLSLEADYGSGKYEATIQEPKARIPGRQILHLSGASLINDEHTILTELKKSPGAAVMSLALDQMDLQDTNAVYSIASNTRQGQYHAIVVSGYDDTGSRNAYWVRDSMKSRTPNEGHYRVTRASGVQSGERNPIMYLIFPYGVSLR
ncbi:macrodontain-1-like [Silene latifolia]|uniref:macrodontain-1-like n=1 Tax=Silene latifolia TaxID=37657 RepID=UPI003D788D70